MKIFKIFLLGAVFSLSPTFVVLAQDSSAGSELQMPEEAEKTRKIQPQDKPKDLTEYLQDREEKASALNLDAAKLFEEGKYEEAQRKWQEAIDILDHPEREYQQRLLDEEGWTAEEEAVTEAVQPQEETLDQKYGRGMLLFEQKEYQEAKELFAQIDALSDGYKDTSSYLLLIDEIMEKEAQLRHDEDRAVLHQDIERDQKEQERQKAEEEELQESVEERERQRRQQEEEDTERLYQEAVGFYKAGELEKAQACFEEVEAVHPGYKFTLKYLDRIRKDIKAQEKKRLEEKVRQEALEREREEKELQKLAAQSEQARQEKLRQEAEGLYQQGKEAYHLGDLEKAAFYFEETKKILPDYRSTVKYLVRIDQEIAQDQQRRMEERRRRQESDRRRQEQDHPLKGDEGQQQHRHKLEMQAQALYEEGKDFYQHRDLAKAKQCFREIEKIVPGYKSAQKFLARIEEDIKSEERYQELLRERARERRLKEKTLFEQQQAREQIFARREKTKGLHETLQRIKSDRRRRLEEKAESLYAEAGAYYKGGLLEMARERFEELEKIFPGYKSAAKYLSRIENDLKAQERRLQKERQQRLHIQQAALKPREGESAVLPDSESRSKDIDFLYKEGILLFKHKYYEEAREKFLAVSRDDPSYKAASKYLERIRAELIRRHPSRKEESFEAFARAVREEKMSQMEKAPPQPPEVSETVLPEPENLLVQKAQEKRRERFLKTAEEKYEKALKLYQTKNFIGAKEEFIEVEALFPGFKDTRDYLSRLDDDIEQQRQWTEKEPSDGGAAVSEPPPIKDTSQEFAAKAEKLFQQGVKFFEGQKLAEAKQKFIEADRLIADYKETKDYLGQIERRLAEELKKESLKKDRNKRRQAAKREIPQHDQKAAAQGKKIRKEKVVKSKTPAPPQVPQEPKKEEIVPVKKKVEPRKSAGGDQRQDIQRLIQEKLKGQYAQAVRLYKKGSYRESRELFQEIDGLYPNYKKTRTYIVQIDRHLRTLPPVSPPRETDAGARAKSISDALNAVEENL